MTQPVLNPSAQKWRIVHTEASAGWSGQEHRVLAELVGFQKRGCQVWLAAPPHSVIFDRAQKAGIQVVPVDFAKPRLPLNILKFAFWLRKNRIQVLNPHSSRDGWLFGVAGRLARVPLIIRTRHIDVDYPNPSVSRHAFTTVADHVLTTSDKIAAHFQSVFQLPKDRVTTLPTGIDLERFQPEGEKASFSFPAQRGVPVIGMVSVLRSWKGHSTFLQAAQLLKKTGFHAHYVIVGEGPGLSTIWDEIHARHLQELVTLEGHREDVPAVLRALNLLVIPSTDHEGIPQIGLQALATKTPVVGSDVGGIPEIIRPGETGRIFPAGDAAALAGAIRETIEQPDPKLVERGFANVQAKHSLDSMLNQLDALYAKKLGGNSELKFKN